MALELISWIRLCCFYEWFRKPALHLTQYFCWSSRRSVHFTNGDGRSWCFLSSLIALKVLIVWLVASCLEVVNIYSTDILAKVKGCFHIFGALRADQCIVLASVVRDLRKKFLDKQRKLKFAENITLQPDTSWNQSAIFPRPSNIDFNFTDWSGTKHTRQTSKPYWTDIFLFKHSIKRDKILLRTFFVKFWSETEREQKNGPERELVGSSAFLREAKKGFAKSSVSSCGRFDLSGSQMQCRIVALLPKTSLEMFTPKMNPQKCKFVCRISFKAHQSLSLF